jgi:hypothetical protein
MIGCVFVEHIDVRFAWSIQRCLFHGDAPRYMTQQMGPARNCFFILVIFVIQKRPATERCTRHLELVQKTTGRDTIWEILRFECGAIATSTETCSAPRRLNSGRTRRHLVQDPTALHLKHVKLNSRTEPWQCDANVCWGSKTEVCPLARHVRSTRRSRHRQATRSGPVRTVRDILHRKIQHIIRSSGRRWHRGVKVDDEIEFGRLQHRHLGRLCALRMLPV